MTTNFPNALDTFTPKVDNFDEVMAADVNNLQDAVAAVEKLLGAPPLGYFRLASSGTYISATSFSVSGNLTAYFNVGTKVRLVNTTTKYGYVLSASYSAPNTTVNLIPNTSYSLANAAITNVDISYSNPPDFPAWFGFTSIVSGSTGSIGTYAEDLVYSRFCVSGRKCTMVIRKRITNLGSWSGDVRIDYPVSHSSGGVPPKIGSGYVFASGASLNSPKGMISISNGSFANFYKTILALIQWADMVANDYILINTSFEI